MIHGMVQSIVLKKSAILSGLGYVGELLIYDAACTDIQVADFRVSHLTVG